VSEQIAQVERDLEDQWRIRSDRLVAQAEERARRKYADLQDEYKILQTQLSEATLKVKRKQKICIWFWYVCHSRQIEHLKRQDTSAQLREARDHLSTTLEEKKWLESELAEVKQRENSGKSQLSKLEQQWKQRLEQVSSRD